MPDTPLYVAAFPYQQDVLALPVTNLDDAATWYGRFGLVEVERRADPVPTVLMERDGVRIGFAINGGDASSDGAAIHVADIEAARAELVAADVGPGEIDDGEHDGRPLRGFFVVAPDGLCYYFHQPVE